MRVHVLRCWRDVISLALPDDRCPCALWRLLLRWWFASSCAEEFQPSSWQSARLGTQNISSVTEHAERRRDNRIILHHTRFPRLWAEKTMNRRIHVLRNVKVMNGYWEDACKGEKKRRGKLIHICKTYARHAEWFGYEGYPWINICMWVFLNFKQAVTGNHRVVLWMRRTILYSPQNLA